MLGIGVLKPPSDGAEVLKYGNFWTWTIEYFNRRVKQQIETWPVGAYADFLRLVGLMEAHGADLRMPHSRSMGQGLFELRCRGADGIGRAFYWTVTGHRIVILHGFIKKTQRTPRRELSTARQRQREVRNAS